MTKKCCATCDNEWKKSLSECKLKDVCRECKDLSNYVLNPSYYPWGRP